MQVGGQASGCRLVDQLASMSWQHSMQQRGNGWLGLTCPTVPAPPGAAGLRQKRVTGADYDALVEELICALKAWRPHVLLQFEVRSRRAVHGWPACVLS